MSRDPECMISVKMPLTRVLDVLTTSIWAHLLAALRIRSRRVLGEDLTLKNSNTNKNLILISGLIIEFIPYVHFCPSK